ncbi:hypothetical protein [Nocardioides sp. YIM 152315]|uniref:hypothetical protein n=1 Tax=Nocardioides sp. YIM 152315 TaxID=3031760 RepID=UPI0023DB7576|nr:hypothetical protein [Nocardioides sp. YIM 152315]MDF1605221.1 hypothetical protein [Nocardioides sp. YIM 152315]
MIRGGTGGVGVTSVRRTGGLVAVSFLSASALGFILLAVVARWLETDQNASFLVLWAVIFGIGAMMSAIDVECSRLSSRADVSGEKVPAQVAFVGCVGGAGGLVACLVLAALPGLGAELTSSPGTFVLTLSAVALFAPLCLTRGVLIGTRRVRAYAVVVVGEALLRITLALVLWLTSMPPSVPAAVAAVAVGGLAWLPFCGTVLRAVSWRGRGPAPSWGEAGRNVGSLGAANGLSTLLMAGYPALVTTVVGSAQGLQTLFAAVVLTRLPLVALSPVQAVAVPLATRAIHSGNRSTLRRWWRRCAEILVPVLAIAAALGWWLGPLAVRVFQGQAYDPHPAMVAGLLAGTCVLAAALLQLAVVVAADRHLWVTITWIGATGAAVACLASGIGSAEARGVAAFVVGATTAYAISSVAFLRALRRRTGSTVVGVARPSGQ